MNMWGEACRVKRYVEHGWKVCARNRNSSRVESVGGDVYVGGSE